MRNYRNTSRLFDNIFAASPHRLRHSHARRRRGFTLIITISLLVLLTIIAVGVLSLSAIELRRSSTLETRSVAMANARLGLMMALNRLQMEVGDDRRITADSSILTPAAAAGTAPTVNSSAVGVWNGWSPDLATRARSGTVTVDYRAPKSQTGFRAWLVSHPSELTPRNLSWRAQSTSGDLAELFKKQTSGFDLFAEKVPVPQKNRSGSFAWAVTQENTKARINIGANDAKRISRDDRMQAPARPNLSISALLKHPTSDGESNGKKWENRPSTILNLGQTLLDEQYSVTPSTVGSLALDYTTTAASLLTNSVKGGLKWDLTTGFDMTDSEFASTTWGSLKNPFRSTTAREYKGQKPLWFPLQLSAQTRVLMDFPPASVNHKFVVNGVPTFDTLRSYYRSYRHLYNSTQGGTTAFERPYSHIASDIVPGRPFGVKSHPSIAPVLDRINFILSIYAKPDGTLCILMSPIVTIWNPHNVDVETEGLVVYPWIDLAIFWNWNVKPANANAIAWNSSLSRFVGEGFEGHGRSSRPYFYLHLTQAGNAVASGTRTIAPTIKLAPGEVRVFGLADTSRRDLEFLGTASQRTWRMRPISSATDLSSTIKGGIVLNMTKSIGGTSNFNYKLQTGDLVNAARVEFDRSTYPYIVSMADSYQIKNSNVELMVEARSSFGSLPALPMERNLNFYAQVHSHRATGKGNDSFSYPPFRFEEIRENPKIIGSLLTYHRVALSSSMPLSDLMFTTNPRQPHINQYLSGTDAGGTKFQTAPHYESLLQGGTSLASLLMETTSNGQKAFYGPSHSASTGRSNLAFFEIPRSPTLSLGSFQHCDITATAFGTASQIANSWASPYMALNSVYKSVTSAPNGEAISPALSVYDHSYLANEALFDATFLSGVAPEFGSRKTAAGSPSVWDSSQVSESQNANAVLAEFFKDPVNNPLRNPRMMPYRAGLSDTQLSARLNGPEKSLRIAAHLLVEGGFNINATSEEAWTAVLSSLRGADPASSTKTAMSRFRHILTSAPTNMSENDPWSGFRTLTDAEVKTLAKNIVVEVRLRGPFLSLGEFVNRQINRDRSLGSSGALQAAIDKSGLNKKFTYAPIDTSAYPNRDALLNANTGTNTPGWLSQADLLHAMAPFITARSDTFTVRSLGEAKDSQGKVISTVRLEAVVQRTSNWLESIDEAELPITDLKSRINQVFGRRFIVLSVREILSDKEGNPV